MLLGCLLTLFLSTELLSLVLLLLVEPRLAPLLLLSLRDLIEALPLLSIYSSRFPDLELILSRLEMTRLLRSAMELLLLRVRVETSTTLVGRADERVLRSTAGRYMAISPVLVRLALVRAEPGLSAFVILFTAILLPVDRSISDLLGPPT